MIYMMNPANPVNLVILSKVLLIAGSGFGFLPVLLS